MATAAAERLMFWRMTEAGLRQWVEANPERVNDRDSERYTPLIAAAGVLRSLSLVVWLLDEKGADVKGTTADGRSALHVADSLDILNALLDRGADVIAADCEGGLPLMYQAGNGTVDMVERLLQDPRVRATINGQDEMGHTALYDVCQHELNSEIAA